MSDKLASVQDAIGILILVCLLALVIIINVQAQSGVQVVADSEVIVEFRQSAVDDLYYIACLQDCDYYFYELEDIAYLHYGFSSEYAAHSYYMQVYSDYFNLSYVPLPPPPPSP